MSRTVCNEDNGCWEHCDGDPYECHDWSTGEPYDPVEMSELWCVDEGFGDFTVCY